MGCQGKKGQLGHLKMSLVWAAGPALSVFVFLARFALESTVCISGFAFPYRLFHVVRLYFERAFTATIQSGQQEFFEIHQATAMALALAVLLKENAKDAFSFAFLRIRRPFLPFGFLFCLFHQGAHTIRDHDPVTRLRRMIIYKRKRLRC